MNKLFLLFFCVVFAGRKISVSIVPSGPFEYARQHLLNAYIRHLYKPYSYDQMEIRIMGKQVMPWTRINEKQNIMRAIMNANLKNIPVQRCLSTYFFDRIEAKTTQVFFITDKEACHSQIIAAETLKNRYTYIFPVGVGPSISDQTLIQLAGPCDTCLPGYNYIHIV